jgi:hypothetical protein
VSSAPLEYHFGGITYVPKWLVLRAENITLIHYMEKTWFLWWIFAVVVIMRWFHLLQSTTELEKPDTHNSAAPPAHSGSGEFSAPKRKSLLV